MLSDIEIAKQSKMKRISEITNALNIDEEYVEYYGKYKAKLELELLETLKDKQDAKLVLVSAISPTPLGEGKSTTTIGLVDALNLIGKKTVGALREPSLGPVFGVKGGAAGGGYAQVNPMADLNLHFTGDLHAMTSANNLISACIDNHIHPQSAGHRADGGGARIPKDGAEALLHPRARQRERTHRNGRGQDRCRVAF